MGGISELKRVYGLNLEIPPGGGSGYEFPLPRRGYRHYLQLLIQEYFILLLLTICSVYQVSFGEAQVYC